MPGTEAQAPVPGAEALPAMRDMGHSALTICNTGYPVLSDDALHYADRQHSGNIRCAGPDGGNMGMPAEGSFTFRKISTDRLFFCANDQE